MDSKHRVIRAMLREMPIPVARKILEENLPPDEFSSIFYGDCIRQPLMDIAEMLCCDESTVKRYRRRGYKKLSALYFSDK